MLMMERLKMRIAAPSSNGKGRSAVQCVQEIAVSRWACCCCCVIPCRWCSVPYWNPSPPLSSAFNGSSLRISIILLVEFLPKEKGPFCPFEAQTPVCFWLQARGQPCSFSMVCILWRLIVNGFNSFFCIIIKKVYFIEISNKLLSLSHQHCFPIMAF